MNTQNQTAPQVVSIDDVSYLISDLTPEVINFMQLMDVTNKRIQEAQLDATLAQAAYNQFGVALREQLINIKPINSEVPAAARKTPGRQK